jgi:hypothetical protein
VSYAMEADMRNWLGSRYCLAGVVTLIIVAIAVGGGCEEPGRVGGPAAGGSGTTGLASRPQAGAVRTNSIGLGLAYVPAGGFLSGCLWTHYPLCRVIGAGGQRSHRPFVHIVRVYFAGRLQLQ